MEWLGPVKGEPNDSAVADIPYLHSKVLLLELRMEHNDVDR